MPGAARPDTAARRHVGVAAGNDEALAGDWEAASTCAHLNFAVGEYSKAQHYRR
jgi:hypothetical protein